jgi:FAD/FMN-containing dehydrogenase
MPAEPPPSPRRRTVLAEASALALGAVLPRDAVAAAADRPLRIGNVTGLYAVEVARVETPRSTEDVVRALADWPGRVAVGGGRYSMGGQVAIAGGLHLDMRGMNRALWLKADERRVRVQAGIAWRDLQDVLDPADLAVRTMQSFANFTVGGAVSVNAHGRYVGHGPVGNTVRALQLVLADGRVVEATPRVEPDLFRAAIGGYGAVGVITEVELDLDANAKIERTIEPVPLADYVRWFRERVLADRACVMHNADLVPPAFDAPVAITWRETAKPLTRPNRLVPRERSYAAQRQALRAVTEVPLAGALRRPATDAVRRARNAVAWRNHEASLDVASLEPASRAVATYALDEFFVPPRRVVPFVREMGTILRRHRVVAVNVSIRHSPADAVSLLPWAAEEVFSLVLFYKQGTDAAARAAVGVWTRELVEAALRHGGRWYLPYQLHATREQFERGYPEIGQLRVLKASVDPRGRFANTLWQTYL